MGTGGSEKRRGNKKEKRPRNSPFYENAAEALDRLTRNRMKPVVDGAFLIIHGNPGIKLLGAIDYLRKHYTVKIVRKEVR